MILVVIILLFVLGLVIGNAFLSSNPIGGVAQVYLGVGVLAGLDSVFGGLKSMFAQEFRSDVFITGFIVNILVAAFFAWFGDRIGVNLYLAAVLVMGWRIFNNLGLIRRHMLMSYNDNRRRKQLEEERQG